MLLTIWHRLNSFTTYSTSSKWPKSQKNEKGESTFWKNLRPVMFAQKLLIYCSHWTRARSNTRRLAKIKKTSTHQRLRDKKTNVVGNASPQCPLERAPWSILTHWCCDKRFSANRSSFNDKNYISTHHIDHESAAIYPANCGLSFSLLLCTASCSQIIGKLKGQLCCPSMIFHVHAPMITPT